MLSLLSPMLKLDDLLPRTLLAAVKTIDAVPELVLTMSFAPDVLIANLIYFLKISGIERSAPVSFVSTTCDESYLCGRKEKLAYF